jgi:hypothetical protein
MAVRIEGALEFLMVLLVLLAGWTGLAAQATAVVTEADAPGQPPETRRERQGEPAAPMIAFIDSPGTICYRPELYTDTCQTWRDQGQTGVRHSSWPGSMPRTRSWYARSIAFVIGPIWPFPTGRPSTSRIGSTSQPVPM